ncbi:hypothetical protein D9X30_4896 [Cupriavidus sp. U2]|uniref:hypothetical protein n=1 Tax=Cupriavidus sp. U2 TaxID=2920269 RepID=UPI00129DC02E|nr:hypothetical protein [Cupriavidus sp. U2]KAI3589313.1 hypothetical protein D9X30_4896 [Cupriavidus sp. U2]
MAIRPKTQIGTIPCLCCGQTVPVKEAENGTINLSCQWCDFPAYAKKGTEAHRRILANVKRPEPVAAPVAAPAANTVPAPTPAPARKPSGLMF